MNFTETAVIKWITTQEGADSKDPMDPGGHTRFGIAQNRNPNIDVRTLNQGSANELLYQKYYLGSGCQHLTWGLALAVCDGAVNQGVTGTVKRLQRALNYTNQGPEVLKPDGIFGSKTQTVIDRIVKPHELGLYNRAFLLREFMALRAKRYGDIAAANPALWRKYGKGWMRRLIRCSQESMRLEREIDHAERLRESRQRDFPSA